jgi:hypothetical protein
VFVRLSYRDFTLSLFAFTYTHYLTGKLYTTKNTDKVISYCKHDKRDKLRTWSDIS